MTPEPNIQLNSDQTPPTPRARRHFERVVGIWFMAWATTALLLVGAFIQYAFWTPAAVIAATPLDQAVFAQANRARVEAGLSPLVEDPNLTTAAAAKAQDMLTRHYFGHFYGTTTPWQFIDATGDSSWHWAGENLAKNYTDPVAMVQAWLDSPSHRANLLSDHYTATGVASASGVGDNGQPVEVTVQLFTGVN